MKQFTDFYKNNTKYLELKKILLKKLTLEELESVLDVIYEAQKFAMEVLKEDITNA